VECADEEDVIVEATALTFTPEEGEEKKDVVSGVGECAGEEAMTASGECEEAIVLVEQTVR
jgi:hypothetical protein